jgi:hypothetical protein
LGPADRLLVDAFECREPVVALLLAVLVTF